MQQYSGSLPEKMHFHQIITKILTAFGCISGLELSKMQILIPAY